MKATHPKPERLFRALADKTRLRILSLLLPGELCVCDLVEALGCPQPTASRHLAYLRKVGLVSARKEGVWSYYQLTPARTDFEAALRKSIECCSAMQFKGHGLQLLPKLRSNCCE